MGLVWNPFRTPSAWRFGRRKNPVEYSLRGDSVSAIDDVLTDLGLLSSTVLLLNGSDTIAAGTMTPQIGPALTISGGPPTQTRIAPWRLSDGTTITSLYIPAGCYLSTATSINPPDNTTDQLALMLMRLHENAGVRVIAGTWVGVKGWFFRGGVGTLGVYTFGDSGVLSEAANVPGGWVLAIAEWDRSANQYIHEGSGQLDADGCPAGSIAGSGFCIGALAGGSNAVQGMDLAGMAIVQKAGLHELLAAGAREELTTRLLGSKPALGTAGTYARAGLRTYYPDGPTGRVAILSDNSPPAGGEAGLGADDAITLSTGKNYLLAAGDTSLWTGDAGVVVSAVTPADAEGTAFLAMLPDAGIRVIRLNNPTAGTLYARTGAAPGAGDAHGSIRAWVLTPAAPPVLGYHTAGGTFVSIGNIAGYYDRTYGTCTAGGTDLLAVELPAGCQVDVIYWCGGAGAVVPDEVPGQADGAASAQGIHTLGAALNDGRGCFEIDLVPQTWGATVPTTAVDIVRHDGDALIGLDGSGNAISEDGTNTASEAITETDGVEETIRASWGDRGLLVAVVDSGSDLASYDGALGAAVTVRGSPRAVSAVRVLRNARWRSTP